MPDRAQIERFLANLKSTAREGGGWYLAKRNWGFLAGLGLTETLAKEVVLGLCVSDCCEGPVGDDNPRERGNVYVFGKEIDGTEVYVKLKIAHIGSRRVAKCLSFHPAERRLHYPFAE
ncbi:MAG: hypothetical protein KKF41_13075 [Actinobacteria bacterium]|nr:hypothetical protein [Actinomycetota bacterium]MBU1944013.1 hypothetical protein [Actinomycetota bacterium]MBU2688509.1 hypothetical protein [Actinomycetota bacterium]